MGWVSVYWLFIQTFHERRDTANVIRKLGIYWDYWIAARNNWKHTNVIIKISRAGLCLVLLIAAEKLNFENFNDVVCEYRNYIRKSCSSLIDAEFSPLFTGANCALILLIVAEKSNFENFNDVIRAYRKCFRKIFLQMKCVEFDSVLPATSCSSISLQFLGYLHLNEFLTSFL